MFSVKKGILSSHSILLRSAVLNVLIHEADISTRLLEDNGILSTRAAPKDLVHLFQRHTLRLGQAEPNPNDATAEEDSKENVRSPSPAGEHGGHIKRHGKVIEPVARRANRHAFGADGQGKDLGDENPRAGSPGSPKGADVDPHKDNGDPAGHRVASPLVVELGVDNAGDDHGNPHDDRTDDEHWLATDLVDEWHGGDGRDEEDDARDTTSEESQGPGSQAEALENVRRVVNDGIDSAPSLEEHDEPCRGDSLEVVPVPQDLPVLRHLPAKYVGVLLGKTREVLLKNALLKQNFSLNLLQLRLNKLIALG